MLNALMVALLTVPHSTLYLYVHVIWKTEIDREREGGVCMCYRWAHIYPGMQPCNPYALLLFALRARCEATGLPCRP